MDSVSQPIVVIFNYSQSYDIGINFTYFALPVIRAIKPQEYIYT